MSSKSANLVEQYPNQLRPCFVVPLFAMPDMMNTLCSKLFTNSSTTWYSLPFTTSAPWGRFLSFMHTTFFTTLCFCCPSRSLPCTRIHSPIVRLRDYRRRSCIFSLHRQTEHHMGVTRSICRSHLFPCLPSGKTIKTCRMSS